MKFLKKNKDPFAFSPNVALTKKRKTSVIENFPTNNRRNGNNSTPFKNSIERNRFIVGGLLCFMVLLVFFIRVLSLQSNADEYISRADDNRIRIISQTAPRGTIFDRNNIPLTKNSPDVGIFILKDSFPTDPKEQGDIFALLAKYTNKSLEEVYALYDKIAKQSSIEPLPLIEHVTHDEAITLSVHANELPGTQLRPKILREYTYPESLAHVLGYIGKMTEQDWEGLHTNSAYAYSDPIGKTGIEESYEEEIKGQNGKEQVEVDALGHIKSVVASEDPTPGKNITLAIDAELQQLLYDEIGSASDTWGGTGGSAVAMDPRNGEVLALVSWPSYNANDFNKGMSNELYASLLADSKKPLFNRSISGEYPSGSTIKPLIAAAALQEGIVSPQTTVLSTGGIQVSTWSFPDWKAGGHGVTNLRKAIAESVNTYFYAIGGGWNDIEGLGVDRIRSYAEKFGLNNQLGIDIQGEASGFLPTKEWKESTKNEPWYIGDTYHLAIGQGDLLVTPLQISSYISVIANGGTLYRPRLVSKIGDTVIEPEIITEHVIDLPNLLAVQTGMRDTVLVGSAKSLSSLSISSAAKTGTAQFGSEGKFHAWFTAFAPYEDPQIVLTILIEGGGEGSTSASPVAKKVLEWWSQNRQ